MTVRFHMIKILLLLHAFIGCEKLESAAIPSTVTYVGAGAFASCFSLKEATFGSITDIPDKMFYDCNEITSITIPDGIKSIGKSAFYSCEVLNGVDLPEGLEKIDDSAFDLTKITGLELPASLKYLGDYTIYESEDEVINLPENLTYIGDTMLSNAISKTVKVTKGSLAEKYAVMNNCDIKYTDEESDYEAGDINMDNNVNLSDVTLALKAALGIENVSEQQIQIADMNSDGKLDLSDVVILLKKALGITA